MESFISTLPPYVHQYINKHPPTDLFNVLRELICFAVLYSNERERINLLSLDLIKKGADQAIIYQPYTSSTLKQLPITQEKEKEKKEKEKENLLKVATTGTTMTTSLDTTPDILSTSPIQELSIPDPLPHNNNQQTNVSSTTSTIPYTFPKWWAHPDDTIPSKANNNNNINTNNGNEKNNTLTTTITTNNATSNGSSAISSSSSASSLDNDHDNHPTPENRPMNITTWVPLEYVDTKSRQRPLSVHNPTIPDLRSYLDSGKSSQTKKTLVQQTKDETKASRRMSAPVPALSTNKMKRVSQQPVIQEIETLSPTSTNTPPLSQSMSRTTTNSSISSTTRSPLYNNNKNNNNENVTPTISRSSSTTMMTRSNSTRTTGSNGSNTSVGGTVYRPGQTATVRARAEAAKKRQLQLEEEKKKKEMQAQLASRTSLKLKQQAKSGIDWDAIKKERRKTIL